MNELRSVVWVEITVFKYIVLNVSTAGLSHEWVQSRLRQRQIDIFARVTQVIVAHASVLCGGELLGTWCLWKTMKEQRLSSRFRVLTHNHIIYLSCFCPYGGETGGPLVGEDGNFIQGKRFTRHFFLAFMEIPGGTWDLRSERYMRGQVET